MSCIKDEGGGTGISRRRFLQLLAAVGATGLIAEHAPAISRALSDTNLRLVWLQAASCNGCSQSMLNATLPDLNELMNGMGADINFFGDLYPDRLGLKVDGYAIGDSQTNPNLRIKEIIDNAKQGTERYVLVVEGAVPRGPQGSGRYHLLNGEPIVDVVLRFSRYAVGTIAFGTCACFGGLHAASAGTGDMRGLAMTYRGDTRLNDGVLAGDSHVINIPGCPPHPDWLTAVLVAMAEGWELPPLDVFLRPDGMFSQKLTLHDLCELRHYHDRGEFATALGEEGCLYRLGCKGPFTCADCPSRRWNDSTEFCISAGSPCLACTEPGFPGVSSPFYTQKEDSKLFAGLNVGDIAVTAGAATGVLVGLHTMRRVIARKKEDDEDESSN